MNRNIEIKAKVQDLQPIRARVKPLADEGPTVLEQEDTFFVCPHGRLKLRRFQGQAEAELIYYERPDSAQPKESRYLVHRTLDTDGLCAALGAALGVRGVVRKHRTLYLVGGTRVHLDEVEGLGTFVELEVVLTAEETRSDGIVSANSLMDQLGIPPEGLVTGAYIDLIEQAAM
ncbi:MAG: class IV adenylate cyclase [Sedimentisphaerales bacterium]|nr:class IV adenylate cyclase [Sedimentisphaerales bacterium]